MQSNWSGPGGGSGGASGFISSIIGDYKIDANTVGGDPAAGYIRYDNATQISALNLTIDHVDQNGSDVDIFLELIQVGAILVIQDKDDSTNNQKWEVSAAPVHTGPTYWTFPVTLRESQGTGTTGFANNHEVFIAATNAATVQTEVISLTIGNGIDSILAGTTGPFYTFPFAGTISSWRLKEASPVPVSSSIVIDIWKDVTANYPPTVADTIAGSEKPTLTSQKINSDTALSTWTTACAIGDVLAFYVDSCSGAKKVVLEIVVEV